MDDGGGAGLSDLLTISMLTRYMALLLSKELPGIHYGGDAPRIAENMNGIYAFQRHVDFCPFDKSDLAFSIEKFGEQRLVPAAKILADNLKAQGIVTSFRPNEPPADRLDGGSWAIHTYDGLSVRGIMQPASKYDLRYAGRRLIDLRFDVVGSEAQVIACP